MKQNNFLNYLIITKAVSIVYAQITNSLNAEKKCFYRNSEHFLVDVRKLTNSFQFKKLLENIYEYWWPEYEINWVAEHKTLNSCLKFKHFQLYWKPLCVQPFCLQKTFKKRAFVWTSTGWTAAIYQTSDLSSSLCRKWRQEVRPCDHVSHEERQIYQTSIPWCWISFASLRGREQNIYKPLSFRTNGELRFYSIKVDGPPAGQKAGSGLLWGKSSNPDFWNYQFCRTLTDTGGMYKIKQSRAPCSQSHHGFMKCTFIIV